MTVTDIVS